MPLLLDKRIATRRPSAVPQAMAPVPAPPVAREAKRSLRPIERLRLLWAASAVSSVGDGLVVVAFPLLAARLSNNPAEIAGVLAATRLPWLLLSLLGGVLADRLDRRNLLVAAEGARMTVLVVLAASVLTDHTTIPLLYVLAFALGTFDSVFATTVDAVVPDVVSDDALEAANGRLVAVQTAGEQFVGPAVGAVLFAAFAAAPFLLDGISFAISGLLLLRAVPRITARSAAGAAPRCRVDREIVAGLRHFGASPALRLLAITIATFAFLQAMVLATLVPYATDVLGSSTRAYGLFIAIAAIGNVVGGLCASRIARRFSAPAILAASGLGAAIAYLAAGATSSLPVATAALAVEAFVVAIANVATMTMRQRLVPAELRGRVGGAFRTCIFGAMPIGALAGGVVAATLGLRSPLLIAGAAQVVVVATLWRRLHRSLAASTTELVALDDDVVVDLSESGSERIAATTAA
jgi:MFS family permease